MRIGPLDEVRLGPCVPTHSSPLHMSKPLEYNNEVLRKGLHVLSLGYPVGFLLIDRVWGMSIMISLSCVAVGLDIVRQRHRGTHTVFDRFFGRMMRPEERAFTGGKIMLNGAVWLTMSFTVLVLLFPEPEAILAYISFVTGDALAALVGRKFGRHPWLGDGRTVEGSLSFFVSASLVAFTFSSWIYPFPVVALSVSALVGTILEAVPLPINDNIVSPAGMALSLVLLSALF